MVAFEFEGNQYECDDSLLHDYCFMADLIEADENPKALVSCFKSLFCGKDREYAKIVGGTIEKMAALLAAAVAAAGDGAKN